MGCTFSSCSNPTATRVCRNVRVVHLNGEVEDFDYPVSVGELTAKLPKHFVCTQSQLLCPCSKPLVPNTYLEPGQIYFLLPFSFFQSNFSPNDLVTVSRKLTSIAKSNRSKICSGNANLAATTDPVCRSPASSSPNLFANLDLGAEKNHMMQPPCKFRSWKPLLATIRERSFNRGSESNLHDKSIEILDTKRSSRDVEF